MAIIVFVGGMLFLVYKSTQQSIELIEEDYYAAELEYQGKIDKKQNLQAKSAKIDCNVSSNGCKITFPQLSEVHPTNGIIRVIRPSDKSMDLSFSFEKLEDRLFQIPLEKFRSGMYKIEAEWNDGDKAYLDERIIHIP